MKKESDIVFQSDFNPSLEVAICTLYERDYHYGLAAFINSLVHKGYNGSVFIGYRDALPPWLNQLQPVAPLIVGDEAIPAYLILNKIRLFFIHVNPEHHLANFKPEFMLLVLNRYSLQTQCLWYFDPDIYLVSTWILFSHWCDFGISVCADINMSVLNENAPLRRRWMEFVADSYPKTTHRLNHYFNSGAIGVKREYSSFLEIWKNVLMKADNAGYGMEGLFPKTRDEIFYAVDQDAMNIALMYTAHSISPLGREAMGFEPGGTVMYHTIGPKPWRGTLKRALQGHAPSNGARYFFKLVAGPVRPYSDIQLFIRKTACSIASFIGRFYDRPIN